MVAIVHSSSLVGAESRLISIEVDMSNSLPGIVIVGLGAKSVDESKERIRSAIKNSQLNNPKKRIIINLSPADLPKNGAHLDVGIALSILLMSGQIPANSIEGTLVLGELGLDGSIRPIHGVIGHILGAKDAGLSRVILPFANHEEAQLVPDVELTPARSLSELYRHLCKLDRIIPPRVTSAKTRSNSEIPDLSDVVGNEAAKRALTIAAAGRHNLLMSGPPGGGKTMLASCLPGILPSLTDAETIETTHLHSLGKGSYGAVIRSPPFRSPHHTASTIALIGGGQDPKPGEVTLAHNGVLFLDELPEFSRSALEVLRQPLEDNQVHISRAQASATFPAKFMLVATRNPCPCGNYNEPTMQCECSARQIDMYQAKLSSPLLDRIDLQVHVGKTKHDDILSSNKNNNSQSASVKKTVVTTQKTQLSRQGKLNSELTRDELIIHGAIEPNAQSFLNSAAEKLAISARSYIRILRVARTVADIADAPAITTQHVAEVLQLRL